MRLCQGQVWKTAEGYVRIVRLERLAVAYKRMRRPDDEEGTHHQATKKEFCRMLQGNDPVV